VPFKLYLACSVLYFVLSALAPSTGSRVAEVRQETTGAASTRRAQRRGAIVKVSVDTAKDFAAVDSMFGGRNTWIVTRFRGGLKSALRDPNAFQSRLVENIPRMMFVLVPMFALVVALLFRRARTRYPGHLVFALHVHAFVFLALALWALSSFISLTQIGDITGFVVQCSIVVYPFLALRAVYQNSWLGTIARGLVLGLVYAICFAVVSLGALLVTLLVM